MRLLVTKTFTRNSEKVYQLTIAHKLAAVWGIISFQFPLFGGRIPSKMPEINTVPNTKVKPQAVLRVPSVSSTASTCCSPVKLLTKSLVRLPL